MFVVLDVERPEDHPSHGHGSGIADNLQSGPVQPPQQRSRESAASSIALLSRDDSRPLERFGKPDCDVASVMLQPRLTGRVPRLDLLHAPPLTLKAGRHLRSGEYQEGVTVAGTTERRAEARHARRGAAGALPTQRPARRSPRSARVIDRAALLEEGREAITLLQVVKALEE